MNMAFAKNQSVTTSHLMTSHDLSGFKVRLSQEPIRSDLSENRLVFNCTRPLVGNTTWDGAYVSGTFYAAIDPDHSSAAEYIGINLKLDAYIPAYVSDIERLGMYLAISNPALRARITTHIEKIGVESAISKINVQKINNLPWNDFKAALILGRILIGLILIDNLQEKLNKNSKTQGEMA